MRNLIAIGLAVCLLTTTGQALADHCDSVNGLIPQATCSVREATENPSEPDLPDVPGLPVDPVGLVLFVVYTALGATGPAFGLAEKVCGDDLDGCTTVSGPTADDLCERQGICV